MHAKNKQKLFKILVGSPYGKERVGRPKRGRKRRPILEIDIREVT
jgi:hypothetical protein